MKIATILTILFLVCFCAQDSRAQNNTCRISDLKSGELLFQSLNCGALCNAIDSVTPAYKGEHFSHVGIIYKHDGHIMVIEAIGKKVHLTPLKKVLKRSAAPVFIGALKAKDTLMDAAVIHFALKQIGVPYDDDFLYNNGKYYCSELVYDAFRWANKGKAFFSLHPMTYKSPGSKKTFPVWKKYFEQKHLPVPEGKPGCNPGGLATSGKLNLYLLQQ